MSRSSASVDVFHAIADVNRRAILDTVTSGEVAVGAIAASVDLSYSATSQHLEILRKAGLLKRRKDGRRRLYRLNARPLRKVHDWSSHYESFWRRSLDRLRDVLGEVP